MFSSSVHITYSWAVTDSSFLFHCHRMSLALAIPLLRDKKLLQPVLVLSPIVKYVWPFQVWYSCFASYVSTALSMLLTCCISDTTREGHNLVSFHHNMKLVCRVSIGRHGKIYQTEKNHHTARGWILHILWPLFLLVIAIPVEIGMCIICSQKYWMTHKSSPKRHLTVHPLNGETFITWVGKLSYTFASLNYLETLCPLYCVLSGMKYQREPFFFFFLLWTFVADITFLGTSSFFLTYLFSSLVPIIHRKLLWQALIGSYMWQCELLSFITLLTFDKISLSVFFSFLFFLFHWMNFFWITHFPKVSCGLTLGDTKMILYAICALH